MYFIGRKKDLIVLTSGINISPNMVETVIYSNIPEVIECLVYTNPDESELYCELFSQK
jgi:long-subunit acyl-CoA synthetase (AMP-forming)